MRLTFRPEPVIIAEQFHSVVCRSRLSWSACFGGSPVRFRHSPATVSLFWRISPNARLQSTTVALREKGCDGHGQPIPFAAALFPAHSHHPFRMVFLCPTVPLLLRVAALLSTRKETLMYVLLVLLAALSRLLPH